MTEKELIKEIANLNLSERILLVGDIWDSIAQANNELPLYEWQKQELNNRINEYNSGNLRLHDWNSVHSVFNNRMDPEKRV
jgi:putative addiction module component (TIGR02574 family)